MLTAAPLPIPEPALAQVPVEELLRHFSTALPWLSDPHGLVQTGIAKDGKSKRPQLYLQDGDLFTKALHPDQRMKALSWFEYEGPADMQWDDPVPVSGYLTHQLAAVVWVNLPAIDPNRPYDFTPELAQDFLVRGLLASPLLGDIQPASIEQRAERVFLRYPGWPENQQLLMHPFGGFRIPFTVRSRLVACPLPFVPAAQPMKSGAATVDTSVDIPVGTLVALNDQGAVVRYDAAKSPDGQALMGIAITNGTAGQQVQVQSSGQVHIDGWNLKAGTTYLAGPAGTLVTTNQGLYFSQVIGRALSPDDFSLNPQEQVILLQP